jgi:hypothetical protein
MFVTIALVLAVSAGIAGLYFYSQCNLLRRRLSQGAEIFEAQTSELGRYKSQWAMLGEQQKSLLIEQKGAASQVAKAHEQVAVLREEMIQKQTYFSRKLSDIEAQRDQMITNFEASEGERKLLATEDIEKRNLRQQNDEAKQVAASNLRLENRELLKQIDEISRELATLKARPTINLQTVDGLRRRSTHNETLFHSMKGLRDMSDERSQNWEIALRKMATWILESSSLAKPNDPILSQSIGPIVGEALERIGGSLLEYSPAEELAAERQALRSPEH